MGAGAWSAPIWRKHDRNTLANMTFPCQGMLYKTLFCNVDYITTAKNVAKSPSEQFPLTNSTVLVRPLSSRQKSKPCREKWSGMYRRENKVRGYELPSSLSSCRLTLLPSRQDHHIQYVGKYLTTQQCTFTLYKGKAIPVTGRGGP
jgi:hypothetical protein